MINMINIIIYNPQLKCGGKITQQKMQTKAKTNK